MKIQKLRQCSSLQQCVSRENMLKANKSLKIQEIGGMLLFGCEKERTHYKRE